MLFACIAQLRPRHSFSLLRTKKRLATDSVLNALADTIVSSEQTSRVVLRGQETKHDGVGVGHAWDDDAQ
jgi:hypothetical protein